MSLILSNDIFDDLIEENKRLLNELSIANELLIKFNDFKCFLELISKQFKSSLAENQCKRYQELSDDIDNTIKSNNFCIKSKQHLKSDRKLNSNLTESGSKFCDNSSTTETSDECLTNGLTTNSIIRSKTNRRLKHSPKSNKSVLKKKRSSPKILVINEPKNSSKVKTSSLPKKSTQTETKNRFICDFIGCGKEFLYEKSFKRHLTQNHKNSDESRDKTIKSLVCTAIGCGKRFSNARGLRAHKQTHNRRSEPIKYNLFCDFPDCPYKTYNKRLLLSHSRRHSSEALYQCSDCSKRFKSNYCLAMHKKRIHQTVNTLLLCAIDGCQRQFKTEESLKLHHNRYHSSEGLIVCQQPGCQFKVCSKSSFDTHLATHSDDRPFQCTVEGCEQRFKLKHSLESHISSVHFSGPKTKCSVEGCEKYFKTEHRMKRHVIVHHSGRSFSCLWPGCDYACKDAHYLKRHTLVHSFEANFVCDWPQCGKRFKRKKYLEDHLRIHTNDKKFVCHWPGCQYRCTNSGNFYKHMNLVHNK